MPESKDIITGVISSLALVFSVWSLSRSWRANVSSLKKVAANSYMNALFDINRQIIIYPQLWAVYDRASVTRAQFDEPIEVARRRAFIWYHLNLFEMVYASFHQNRLAILSRDDLNIWSSWNEYMRAFLAKSPEATAVVESPELMKLLTRDFAEHLRGCIAKTRGG